MTSQAAAVDYARRRSDATLASDDVSESRSRININARARSRLAEFVPQRTQIPRVPLTQPRRDVIISRQNSRDSHLTSSTSRDSQPRGMTSPHVGAMAVTSRPAFSRQSTRNDVRAASSAGGSNLHRSGATLSLDDLLLSKNTEPQRSRQRLQRHNDVTRPSYNRDVTEIPRPRLRRRQESGEGGWGRQRSRESEGVGRENGAFEDDALRPYYLRDDTEVRNFKISNEKTLTIYINTIV